VQPTEQHDLAIQVRRFDPSATSGKALPTRPAGSVLTVN
jgi:hypothetical protein